MDITTATRLYVQCASNGTITEPTGGSWMSAYALYLGATEPVNASWLQTVCIQLGITQTVNGSWLIALAAHYNIPAPVNGTWMNAIQDEVCNGVPTLLVWNLVTSLWNLETTQWATGVVPASPTLDQDGQEIQNPFPVLTGTSEASCYVTLTIDGSTYKTQADIAGVWSIPVINELSGQPSPGTNYPITMVCMDATNGLESPVSNASVGIVVTLTTLTLQLSTQWSLYWYSNNIQIEKESSPGVWDRIEYEGNIRYGNNFSQYYKQDVAYGIPPTDPNDLLYTMNFQNNDEFAGSPGEDTPREIILDLGFNYRIVAKSWNPSANNYGRYANYEVFKDGNVPFLPLYNTPTDIEWQDGYIQQTFTL